MSQFNAIYSLLTSVAPACEFQKKRIAGIGDIKTIDDFCDMVPFTTKADLVADFAAHPPYGSNLTYPLERYTRFCQTSGTSSEPLPVLDTNESWDWMLMNWAGVYAAAGLDKGDRVYFAFSFGPFLGFWTAYEAAVRCGYLSIPGGGLSSAARLAAIFKNRTNVLCCTPTYALHLAEVANKEGISMNDSPVQKIIVAGEPGGSIPAVRERISGVWKGAEVFDHYGMTETGPVAYQRKGETDTLYIIEESYFAEIIDPVTTRQTDIGEIGELVLTPLGRHAWPLLRYRTGDLVRRKKTYGFVLDGGIIGRVDDMVVIRGVNIYPSAVDALIRQHSTAEYRVTVTTRKSMPEMAVEVEGSEPRFAQILEKAFEITFSLRVPVEVVPPGSLPRYELKAKRWVKE